MIVSSGWRGAGRRTIPPQLTVAAAGRPWQIVEDNRLSIRTEEPLSALKRHRDGTLTATTPKAEYRTRKIVLATGQRGSPRKLLVPGEEREQVYHRLYSPRRYEGEEILVIGGGNSAIEAALTLSERNHVTLCYRGTEFGRVFKDNREALDRAIEEKRIEPILRANVREFRDGEAVLVVADGDASEERRVPMDHAFCLIGAELPVKFLKGLGIRLENEWDGSPLKALGLSLLALTLTWLAGPLFDGPAAFNLEPTGPLPLACGILAAAAVAGLIVTGVRGDRWAWLTLSFLAWYSIYGIKVGSGQEFWPFRGWGYDSLSFFQRPWAFWYTVLYTALMTGFGLQALKRWGLDRKDKLHLSATARYFMAGVLRYIPEMTLVLNQWANSYKRLVPGYEAPVYVTWARRNRSDLIRIPQLGT